VSPRAEGGDYGGLPEDYGTYGDREFGDWHEYFPGAHGARYEPRPTGGYDENDDYVRESDVARVERNDRVRLTKSVDGIFTTKVPKDARGVVESTRNGVFTSYATVRFENGRTEEVKTSDLKKLGWFD